MPSRETFSAQERIDDRREERIRKAEKKTSKPGSQSRILVSTPVVRLVCFISRERRRRNEGERERGRERTVIASISSCYLVVFLRGRRATITTTTTSTSAKVKRGREG